MKKILGFVLVALFVIGMVGSNLASAESIKVKFDDEYIETDVKMVNGKIYLPMRDVFEGHIFRIDYQAKERKITISSRLDRGIDGKMQYDRINVWHGDKEAYDVTNNELFYLEAAPIVENGKTYVPLRSLIEKLRGRAQWDSKTKTASTWSRLDKLSMSYDKETGDIFIKNGSSKKISLNGSLQTTSSSSNVQSVVEEIEPFGTLTIPEAIDLSSWSRAVLFSIHQHSFYNLASLYQTL